MEEAAANKQTNKQTNKHTNKNHQRQGGSRSIVDSKREKKETSRTKVMLQEYTRESNK